VNKPEDKNTLHLISDITEFNDLHDFMQDEHLDKALAIVVKLLMNPDVPSAKAPHLIMELQANYSVKESIDKLVDALKYVVRYNS